jgi:hypothetical protein
MASAWFLLSFFSWWVRLNTLILYARFALLANEWIPLQRLIGAGGLNLIALSCPSRLSRMTVI